MERVPKSSTYLALSLLWCACTEQQGRLLVEGLVIACTQSKALIRATLHMLPYILQTPTISIPLIVLCQKNVELFGQKLEAAVALLLLPQDFVELSLQV